jgi:hypothetical protein
MEDEKDKEDEDKEEDEEDFSVYDLMKETQKNMIDEAEALIGYEKYRHILKYTKDMDDGRKAMIDDTIKSIEAEEIKHQVMLKDIFSEVTGIEEDK